MISPLFDSIFSILSAYTEKLGVELESSEDHYGGILKVNKILIHVYSDKHVDQYPNLPGLIMPGCCERSQVILTLDDTPVTSVLNRQHINIFNGISTKREYSHSDNIISKELESELTQQFNELMDKVYKVITGNDRILARSDYKTFLHCFDPNNIKQQLAIQIREIFKPFNFIYDTNEFTDSEVLSIGMESQEFERLYITLDLKRYIDNRYSIDVHISSNGAETEFATRLIQSPRIVSDLNVFVKRLEDFCEYLNTYLLADLGVKNDSVIPFFQHLTKLDTQVKSIIAYKLAEVATAYVSGGAYASGYKPKVSFGNSVPDDIKTEELRIRKLNLKESSDTDVLMLQMLNNYFPNSNIKRVCSSISWVYYNLTIGEFVFQVIRRDQLCDLRLFDYSVEDVKVEELHIYVAVLLARLFTENNLQFPN